MTLDHNGERSPKPITEHEGVPFAATPVWDRGRKRRGGRKVAAKPASATTVAPAEPRTFADATPVGPSLTERPMTGPMAAPAASTAPRMEPRRTTATTRSNAGPAVAIAAVVVGLGIAGGAAWYAMHDSQRVPELAAGTPEPVTGAPAMAAAQIPPSEAPASAPIVQAANETAPPPAPVRKAPAPAPRATPKASAASAEDTGVNASATTALPGEPVPYSELNPQAAPTYPVAPSTETTPPVTSAPPATEQQPAEIPTTPPILPSEPQTTSPVSPQSETPPTI